MSAKSELLDRYNRTMDRVAAAAERSGRRLSDVLVVAVTKFATPDQIRTLIEQGHQDFAENYAQNLQRQVAMVDEFLERQRMFSSVHSRSLPGDVRWHMIGNLQRKKIKHIIPMVKLIHSVGSLRLAEEIQNQAAKLDQDVDVLIQVNISGESTKGGVVAPAARHLVAQLQTMFHLRVRGLMTMAPHSDNPEDSRSTFERLADLFHEVRNHEDCGDHFNILSMGMTNDFEVAIECGANMVRIGRAIFGERDLGEAPPVETDDASDDDGDIE